MTSLKIRFSKYTQVSFHMFSALFFYFKYPLWLPLWLVFPLFSWSCFSTISLLPAAVLPLQVPGRPLPTLLRSKEPFFVYFVSYTFHHTPLSPQFLVFRPVLLVLEILLCSLPALHPESASSLRAETLSTRSAAPQTSVLSLTSLQPSAPACASCTRLPLLRPTLSHTAVGCSRVFPLLRHGAHAALRVLTRAIHRNHCGVPLRALRAVSAAQDSVQRSFERAFAGLLRDKRSFSPIFQATDSLAQIRRRAPLSRVLRRPSTAVWSRKAHMHRMNCMRRMAGQEERREQRRLCAERAALGRGETGRRGRQSC